MAPPAALRELDGFAFTYVAGVLITRGRIYFLGGAASGGCFVNDLGPFLTVDFGTLNGEYRAANADSLINLTLLQAEPLHGGAQVIGMVDARCERSARFIDVCSNWRINGLARFGIFIQNHRKGFSISAYCRIFITKSNDATIRQGFIQPYPSRFCRAEVKAREHQGNGHRQPQHSADAGCTQFILPKSHRILLPRFRPPLTRGAAHRLCYRFLLQIDTNLDHVFLNTRTWQPDQRSYANSWAYLPLGTTVPWVAVMYML